MATCAALNVAIESVLSNRVVDSAPYNAAQIRTQGPQTAVKIQHMTAGLPGATRCAGAREACTIREGTSVLTATDALNHLASGGCVCITQFPSESYLCWRVPWLLWLGPS